jgi:hypothetical protein
LVSYFTSLLQNLEWSNEAWCNLASYLEMVVDVSYAAPHVHGIVNVALHREYSQGIVIIFFQGRKDLYHV